MLAGGSRGVTARLANCQGGTDMCRELRAKHVAEWRRFARLCSEVFGPAGHSANGEAARPGLAAYL